MLTLGLNQLKVIAQHRLSAISTFLSSLGQALCQAGEFDANHVAIFPDHLSNIVRVIQGRGWTQRKWRGSTSYRKSSSDITGERLLQLLVAELFKSFAIEVFASEDTVASRAFLSVSRFSRFRLACCLRMLTG